MTVHVLWVCGKISFTKLPSQVQCPAQALLGRRHTFQVTGMQGGLVSQELAMQRAGDPCLVAFGVSPPFLAEIGPRLPPHLLNCVSGENPLAPRLSLPAVSTSTAVLCPRGASPGPGDE